MKMKRDNSDIFALVACVLLVAGGIWFGVAQWAECKEMGHSTFYCVAHVLG